MTAALSNDTMTVFLAHTFLMSGRIKDESIPPLFFRRDTQVDRKKPPRGGFLFTMFPHQEPRGRGTPSTDGVAINEALKIVYILEFKRSTDRDEGFLEVKDAKAHEQHKCIIGALKAAAPEWEFEQINFVVGNRGLVVESNFYTKLKNLKLDIQEGKTDKLFADHVTQVCEAHNRVIVSFLQQVQRGTRSTTEGSRENIGTVCTCEEMERGTHACKASKLGPVERWWTQDGKLGIAIQDPPPESGRRTHLLYFTYSYCILSCV